MKPYRIKCLISILLLLGTLSVPLPARGAALTWTGGGADNNFNTAGNWSPSQTPGSGDTCTISNNTAPPRQPSILTNAACGSLTLGTGSATMTLSFDLGRNLTISGDVTIGANGQLTPIGTTTGVFTIGGNWSDDLAVTNITSANFHNSIVFSGTTKTISTNETRFWDVQITGSISLTTDFAFANSFSIVGGGTFTHGANTLAINGSTFSTAGTYNYTCSSIIAVNTSLTMGNNQRFPNAVINSGGSLSAGNPSYIDCDMTLQAGGTLTVTGGLHVAGDWIRNGGTFTTAGTVTMTGVGKQIRGTTPTTFHHLTIGDGAGDSTTLIFDTPINSTLTVFAGAAMTVDTGKTITHGGSATISGSLYLSGTTTWTMTSGGTLTVASGGLISAQGTDTSNRVTFTRSGASFYDLVIDGGIDFNYVNVYYTRSAAAGAGFAINSPGGATVVFNYVALNFTENVNKATMFYWNANRTVSTIGCTFDSATYTPGEPDVNVKAVQGTINFFGYGGNYGGEALDDDVGGTATWTDGILGTVYTDEGVTNIGAGKTVRLVKNGATIGSNTTDAAGKYAISATIAANDLILVYIDNDATYKANTVTQVAGASIAGLDLYAARVITRCDNSCSLSIANMNTALGAYTDAGDILYSVSGGNLTVTGSGTAINVLSGHTFAPASTITVTPKMEVRGTFTAGGFTHTLSGTGTPFVVTGTFTSTGSTIKYTGTTTATNIAATNYNNLQLTPTGATTYSLTGHLTGGNALTGNLTIDANATLDATTASNYNLTAVNVTINAGGTYLAKASTITASGNWSNSGTFTAATSTVTFSGANQSLTGSTTFNHFTKSVATARTLTFAAGSTTTINGTATLNGASGQLLSLVSSSSPTKWNFTLGASAVKAISFVDVKDSDATGSAAGQKPINPTSSVNSGNNFSWFGTCPVVTITADTGDGSLRECINYANATAGANTITFNITGCPGGICTITPASVLPALSDATGGTTIDGYTQAGAGANTVASPGASDAVLNIQLSGGGANYAGLTLSSANNVVKGLVINGFSGVGSGYGINITGSSATGNTVSGNYLGTNTAGTAGAGNYIGVDINGGAQSNTVGGTTPAARNLISGNTSDGIDISGATTSANIVKGNYIGTQKNGTSALANTYDGVGLYAPSNLIGGATAAERNIISGNGDNGITIGGGNATSNTIQGNWLGTDVNGASRPNGGSGIRMNATANSNIVGGTSTGEGNTMAFNTLNGISIASTGNQILGNTIYSNTQEGIKSSAANQTIAMNLIRNNGGVTYNGVALNAGATNNKLYHNTIHANGASGVYINETGSTIRNNIITGNAAYGINRVAASMTESYNIVTDAATAPANASGRSNVALDATDLNADPLYVNAAGGDFTLTECTSPGINAGIDLGGDQPDMNGGTAGLWNNNAPEMGAFETSAACAPVLVLVKQAWLVGGTSPLALTNGAPTSTIVPAGQTIVFLIYFRNTTAGPVTDLRFSDLLDVTASGFTYETGTLVRTSAGTPPADTATDLQIFDSTAPGTGTALTDAVDGDEASICDSTAGACPGTTLDRVTVGNTTGLTPAQANGSLSVGGHTTFGIRFRVTKN